MNIALDLRLVIAVLLLVIAGMLVAWKPWDGAAASGRAESRTIKVTGEASLKAEPDEYQFYPSYQFKNADKEKAMAEMSAKSDELIAKLKALGVSDSQIKSNANNYDTGIAYPGRPEDGSTTYTLQLTVNVSGRDKAQKVQDYLTSTTPSGAVTPNPTFSTAKRKELENKARDEATKDARAKAEQSAGNLGAKLGDVKTVSDGSGFGGYPVPMERGVAMDTKAMSVAPQISVQPGQNELAYSVTVEYYIR